MGGMEKVESRFLRTSDGADIEITQEMFEDFYVLASVYRISVKDILNHILDDVIGPDLEA
jgi:hypothetical protein